MRLWRNENNALLRQKMSQESMRTTTPLLEAIIEQGCREGVFDTEHPHEAAIIITGMGLHLADAIIDAIDADGAESLNTKRIPGATTSSPPTPSVRTDPRRAVGRAHNAGLGCSALLAGAAAAGSCPRLAQNTTATTAATTTNANPRSPATHLV